MSRSVITQAGNLVRATVWTIHGTSTKTFTSLSEARAWIAMALNRKPLEGKQ